MKLKIPAVVEFPSGDIYEVDTFISIFKKLTGIKLKKKCLDKGYGSSYWPWLLFTEKNAAYIRLLEKHSLEGF